LKRRELQSSPQFTSWGVYATPENVQSSATVMMTYRKNLPMAMNKTQGQKGRRNQPATMHKGSPTKGSQEKIKAGGPKRCTHRLTCSCHRPPCLRRFSATAA